MIHFVCSGGPRSDFQWVLVGQQAEAFFFKPRWKLTQAQAPKAAAVRLIFKTEGRNFCRDNQRILTKRSHKIPAIQSLMLCRTARQWKPQIKQMHQNAMHTNVPVFLCKTWSDNEKHFLEVPLYDIKQASNNLKYRGTLTFELQEFCFPSCFSPLWILHLNNWNFQNPFSSFHHDVM